MVKTVLLHTLVGSCYLESRNIQLSNRSAQRLNSFKVYLIGKPFVIQTDHRSLKWLNRLKENNSRLTRWSLALQPFTFVVEHRSGTANGNADALSRCATDIESMSVSGEEGRSVSD